MRSLMSSSAFCCCNRKSQTRWFIGNQNWFGSVWRLRSPRLQGSNWWMPSCYIQILGKHHMGTEKGGERRERSKNKRQNPNWPCMRTPLLAPMVMKPFSDSDRIISAIIRGSNHHLNTPPLNTVTLDINFPTLKRWGKLILIIPLESTEGIYFGVTNIF